MATVFNTNVKVKGENWFIQLQNIQNDMYLLCLLIYAEGKTKAIKLILIAFLLEIISQSKLWFS